MPGQQKAYLDRRWLLATVLVTALLGVLVVAATTTVRAWQQRLAAEERLLPGVRVAGTDLGMLTLDEARTITRRAADAALDRPITVVHGDREWRLTPREVGARTSAEEQLESAAAATRSAPITQVAMVRWLGGSPQHEIDTSVRVPATAILEFVDDVARAVDVAPQDATAEWTPQGLRVREPVPGLRVDRAAAAADVLRALRGSAARVDLPVRQMAASVDAHAVRRVLPAVAHALETAFDRAVTITYEGRRWRTSPRQLGAVPDLQPAVDAALDRHGQALRSGQVVAAHTVAGSEDPVAVPFEVPNPALGELLDTIAAHVSHRARDAAVDYSTGWVKVVPGAPGRTVDRHRAAVRLREALSGHERSVELPVRETSPGTADLPQVLLVRQDERRLYLYEHGRIVRDWPVAVGQAGADTPTGVFTVGAKRVGPTWFNPAPTGWGADMPRVIGPGPHNPLGLRAINWDDGGRDTLIRFHGTANAGSIGRAASRGCVRLTNADVVELFDLVEPGATIVSVRG